MHQLNSLIIALLLTSCVTRQKCFDRFPPETKTIVTTVIKDSIVTRVDSVLVPYRHIVFTDDSPCPELVTYHGSIKKNGLVSTVIIKDGKLTSKCEADSLLSVIEVKDCYITTLKTELSNKVTEVVKFKERWYNPYSLYISFIFIIALIFWVYFKIIK